MASSSVIQVHHIVPGIVFVIKDADFLASAAFATDEEDLAFVVDCECKVFRFSLQRWQLGRLWHRRQLFLFVTLGYFLAFKFVELVHSHCLALLENVHCSVALNDS